MQTNTSFTETDYKFGLKRKLLCQLCLVRHEASGLDFVVCHNMHLCLPQFKNHCAAFEFLRRPFRSSKICIS